MTTQTFTPKGPAFLFGGDLAACSLARDAITLASGQDLGSGAVLGKITKALAAGPIPAIVGTGTGAMTALTFGPDVQTGNYVIELTETSSTAAFTVTCPDGTKLHNGAVGTAYKSRHLSFLVSDGGTMTTGDKYTVAVTAGGTPAVIGGTGTGTMSDISLGPDAQNGGYRVVCIGAATNGGDFDVLAPDGSSIGRFVMGTGSTQSASFTSRHINFTLTDATDFIVGNYFNVIVAKGSQKYKALAPTATDGTHEAAGILWEATDASTADTAAVAVTRQAEVISSELQWGASVGTAHKAAALAQLAKLGIIAR
jgi:hypothetical protein